MRAIAWIILILVYAGGAMQSAGWAKRCNMQLGTVIVAALIWPFGVGAAMADATWGRAPVVPRQCTNPPQDT